MVAEVMIELKIYITVLIPLTCTDTRSTSDMNHASMTRVRGSITKADP